MPPSASTAGAPEPALPGCSNVPSSGMLGRAPEAPSTGCGVEEGEDSVPDDDKSSSGGPSS
eukprot:10825819-Karenia_brevis.AAC.1